MRWLGRVILILLLLLVGAWTFMFVSLNLQPVSLNLLPLELTPRPLGELVVIAFVVGATVGLLGSSTMFLRHKRRERRLQRELRSSRAELQSERSLRAAHGVPSATAPAQRNSA